MEKVFLYVDILGFASLIKNDPKKVDRIFGVIDSLAVHKHFALKTIVFSDTILVFSDNESYPQHYFCTFLIEYVQELFYKLSLMNIYFRAILTSGDFNYSKLNNIQAYYGLALINAYESEKGLEGFGLYADKRLEKDIVVFDKVDYNEQFDFILLCQSMKNLYLHTSGILPVEMDMLNDTDTFHRLDEELRFFREVEYCKTFHPSDKVKAKHQKVYDLYKKEMPKFFRTFEEIGFYPSAINHEYTGSFNPYIILAEQEIKSLRY